ncbi:hypothetical protein KHO49_17320 [Pseudomonas sp. RC4D1]|uniref:hypothetical protein n=1 Tax=Pseudomonas sp. RC4D1 TaxID=2834407 RepID=UPI001BCEC440|nr:hypothetical protein [Pseudomonas sp. RC4D1]MBS7560102.1 hypothetical protein [Pseudomonas sp. RC4D1]
MKKNTHEETRPGQHLITQQPLVDRDYGVVGFDMRLINSKGIWDLSESTVLSDMEYKRMCCELLARTSLAIYSATNVNYVGKKSARKRFISIRRSDLLDITLLNNIIRCGEALAEAGLVLVLVLVLKDEVYVSMSLMGKVKIVKHLYEAKYAGVKFCCERSINFCEFDGGVMEALNLCDFVLISMRSLSLISTQKARGINFELLHERMCAEIESNKVKFIAAEVDSLVCNDFARALPFIFFKGGVYNYDLVAPANYL